MYVIGIDVGGELTINVTITSNCQNTNHQLEFFINAYMENIHQYYPLHWNVYEYVCTCFKLLVCQDLLHTVHTVCRYIRLYVCTYLHTRQVLQYKVFVLVYVALI